MPNSSGKGLGDMYFSYKGSRCYFQELGEGRPLLFLHGNTASSVMFQEFAPEFSEKHRTILIDFLGHGRSDRLEAFETDLWFEEACQVIAFLDEYNLKEVDLLGSSGGALVAINVALERPDLVRRVVADSFEGEHALKEFTDSLEKDREASKEDAGAAAFYEAMHGEGWQQVVDNDTKALVEHSRTIGNFFHRPLSELKAEILLTGSRGDEFVSFLGADYFDRVYGEMIRKIGHGRMHIFDEGRHPAALSNGEEFIGLVQAFLDGR